MRQKGKTMKSWWISKLAKGVLIVTVALFAFGFIVMLLWNALIPQIFNGPVLTFWQAAGLLLLSHILLRGWGGRYSWRRSRGWKGRFEEKLAAMTPEERETFKKEWRERCGWYPGMEKDIARQQEKGTTG